MSGGPVRAADGTLTIMVGASNEAFERAKPVLSAMGTPNHLGAVGMGETVKLVNQIIIANVMIANIEALSFAKEAGANSKRCARCSPRQPPRTTCSNSGCRERGWQGPSKAALR